ncbi:MAG: class I SAM-dependent methyltransferase [Candidatus Omnitrophica bacterium]|nr:class I SAM-dependent methyltransferase [Candidatus Omnitrophota bacterium]
MALRGRAARPAAGAAGEFYEGTQGGRDLEVLADARNYYRWILRQFAPFLGRRVVEIGAGLGNFSRVILSDAGVSEAVLVEPAANLFPRLRERFAGDPRVQTRHGLFEDVIPESMGADSVVLVNVLEHVEDDLGLLRHIRQRLIPGGHVLLFVPALPALFGSIDEVAGHYRRYLKPSLAAQLAEAGFTVERLRYVNLPGTIAWFLIGRVLKWRVFQPGSVQLYDRLVIPLIAALERWWEPPVGQSLIAIARK